MKKILIVAGTRPEIIKTATMVIEARRRKKDGVQVTYCLTGQHQTMAMEALAIFGVTPDDNLEIMKPGQTLNDIEEAVFRKLPPVIEKYRPDVLLVQGDTTTAAAAALCAFNMNVPVGHIEAGLRSFNMAAPYPEECNRRVIGVVSAFNFCPTEPAKQNLVREGVPPATLYVTGNTVVDALQYLKANHSLNDLATAAPSVRKPFVLITAHRRESFGEGFENICRALRASAQRHPHVQFVYPVHLNPNVKGPVHELLGGIPNVLLIPPVPYLQLLTLLNNCDLVVTDSGGIQEEAPSFGKYCVVMRDVTERMESVTAGLSELVGTDIAKITAAVDRGLSQPIALNAPNPYGDGRAAERMIDILLKTDSKA